LTYQWLVSDNFGFTWGDVSSTATNASYTNVSPTLSDNQKWYQVIVSGVCTPAQTSTPPAVLTVRLLATASAGGNQSICAGQSTAGLGGTVGGGALGGVWSSSGSGSFAPSATALNATYAPSAADIATGTVTLTLSAQPCGDATAQVVVTINTPATASAGANQTICSSGTAALSGSVGGGATGGTWATSGSGSFSPNATTLNATYTPSAADINAGAVTLTLTSTGQLAPCAAATSQIVVTIHPAATASAGANQTICSGSTVALGGTVGGGATGGTWATSGSGSFAPDATTLNATYTPSAADISAGAVTRVGVSNVWETA